MFSHVMFGTHNLPRAIAFYDAALMPLGIERVPSKWQTWAAWQRPGEATKFWVGTPYNGLPASWGNGTIVAFVAPGRASVGAAHTAALSVGGVDEGGPGLRPTVAADYYGACVRDPDGNKVYFFYRGETS
jgi:catechol 2,3-dioxygenase-like lactoylglutathione lyase family enzyme